MCFWRKEKKGFGPDFLQWVRVLMSDTKSCVNYCGWLSVFFGLFFVVVLSVDFGIRQGCPFSPLPFVLAIDLLAIKIRHLQNIKGIRNWSLNNVSYIEDMIKTDLYADHTALFLNDEDDRRYALNVIHEFCIFYGWEVNKSHTPLHGLTFLFFSLFVFNIIRKSCHLRF